MIQLTSPTPRLSPFQQATGELHDDDLEQVVGGLARAFSGVEAIPTVAVEGIVVSVVLADAMPQRISAA